MTKPLNRRPLLWGCILIIGVALATATAAQKTPPDFPLTMEELEAFANPDELALVRSYSYYEDSGEPWFLEQQYFLLEETQIERRRQLVHYSIPGVTVKAWHKDRWSLDQLLLGVNWSADGNVVNLFLSQLTEEDLALLSNHRALKSIFISSALEKNVDLDLNDLTAHPHLESLSLGKSQLFNIQALCSLNHLQWFTAPVSYPQGPIRFSDDCAAPIKMLGFETARLDDLEVANLSSLIELHLVNAIIHGLAIEGSSLPALEYINLRDAELPDDLSDVHLPEGLVQLNLQGATNDSVNQLDLPDNLKYLDLSGSRLTDYSFITTAKNLESLSLDESNFQQFELLKQLPMLKHLSLSYIGRMDEADLIHLATLSELQYLDIPGAQITTMQPLANLRDIRFLHIGSTNISDYNQIPYFPDLIGLALPNQDDEYESTDQLPEHIQKMLAASWLDEYRRNYGESCLGQTPCTVAPWMITDDTY